MDHEADRKSEFTGRLIGNYRILNKVGSGGMGTVYEAEDIRLRRRVALKLLRDGSPIDEQSVQRFRQEVLAASSLNHPHICTVYDAGEDRGIPYFAMELLDGQTLAEMIGAHPLPVETILRLGIEIADALDCAHANGIVHRDLKPANIFVTGRGAAKLLDFGVSKQLRSEVIGEASQTRTAPITMHGNLIGTGPYMSPEQAQGKPIDRRSDLFSLGAVLYEMGTGVPAFRGESLAAILADVLRVEPEPATRLNSQLPDELQRIITKALEKDPDDRYQSAKDLLIDLRRLQKQTTEPSRAAVAFSGRVIDEGLPVRPRKKANLLQYGSLATLVGLAIVIAIYLIPTPVPGPLNSEQITFSLEPKEAPLLTDGTRLYFSSRGIPSEMPVNGGPIAPLRGVAPGMRLVDVAADGSKILALKSDVFDREIGLGSLWVLSTVGGEPSRLGNALAQAARWSPDGRSLVFGNQKTLYSCDADGGTIKKLWLAPGYVNDPSFSPDGRELAVTASSQGTARIWRLKVTGGDAHPLQLAWPENVNIGAGQWLRDERHFLFTSDREGLSNVYEFVQPQWFRFWTKPSPVRITGNQLQIEAYAPARSGARVFVLGRLPQGAMQVLDPRIKRFVPFLDGLPAVEFVISPDRQWMAYSEYPTRYLWKSRIDGSEKLQLTHSHAVMQQWSPDGKWLVYSDWKKLYKVAADGGAPEKLIPAGDQEELAPTWSADGKSIAFNYFPYPNTPLTGIHVLNLASRELSVMPGSEGLYVPSWSPDGEFLVAIAQEPSRMMLYTARTKTWKELKQFDALWGYWIWARDSKSLYMAMMQGQDGIYKLTAPQGVWQKISSLEGANVHDPAEAFLSLTVDGNPAIMSDTSVAQIYALH
jgi:serine/threonine protein kinase/Tol biopolymer transport system component